VTDSRWQAGTADDWLALPHLAPQWATSCLASLLVKPGPGYMVENLRELGFGDGSTSVVDGPNEGIDILYSIVRLHASNDTR